MASFIIALNFFKGATIIVNNCNSDTIADARICHNSEDYYYLDNKGTIHHINIKNNVKDIFNNTLDYKCISCNSSYLYAATDNTLFQFDYNGTIVNSINRDSREDLYSLIDGLYATNDCLFCQLGSSYLLLDSMSLDTISITDVLGQSEWITIDKIQFSANNSIKMVSSAVPVELDKSFFDGTIILDANRSLNLCHNGIIGLSDSACMEYIAYNGTLLKNLYNGTTYNIDRTDIRHLFMDEDFLITFSSNYNDNNLLKKCCILYDEYSVRDFGLYNECPLMFHNYDQITIINLKTETKKTIKTRLGEKIIYLSNKKAVSFYKGQYLFYDIENWKEFKSINADEINSHSTYKFESCGDYIFVFDNNSGELLNTIDVS